MPFLRFDEVRGLPSESKDLSDGRASHRIFMRYENEDERVINAR